MVLVPVYVSNQESYCFRGTIGTMKDQYENQQHKGQLTREKRENPVQNIANKTYFFHFWQAQKLIESILPASLPLSISPIPLFKQPSLRFRPKGSIHESQDPLPPSSMPFYLMRPHSLSLSLFLFRTSNCAGREVRKAMRKVSCSLQGWPRKKKGNRIKILCWRNFLLWGRLFITEFASEVCKMIIYSWCFWCTTVSS